MFNKQPTSNLVGSVLALNILLIWSDTPSVINVYILVYVVVESLVLCVVVCQELTTPLYV